MFTPNNLPIELISELVQRESVQSPVNTTGREVGYRCAAVLLPLVVRGGEWHLLFTQRSENLPDHKGQVAFPGGACEIADHNPAETALRETFEEIGVRPEDVCVIGYLDRLISVTSFLITPVVGTFSWPYDLRPSPDEVTEVFTVPLAWLANPANREEKSFFHPILDKPQMVIYYVPYKRQVIWGLTARITLTFLQTLGLIEE